MPLSRSSFFGLVATLLAVGLVGVVQVVEPRAPHQHVARNAEESVRDEYAVGFFRFYLPPGYRAVTGQGFEALLREASEPGRLAQALGAKQTNPRPPLTHAFESEAGRFRVIFGAQQLEVSDATVAERHRLFFTTGDYAAESRVGLQIDISGLPATVSTLHDPHAGGLRVYDFHLSQDPGRLHTIVIQFTEQEDDRGGRLASLLQSLRVETPPEQR